MSEPATLGYVLGQYKLNAVCLDCGRCVELAVPELIEKYGEDFEVPRLSKMAKCTECGSPHGCGVDLGLLESPDGSYPDFKHGG